MLSPTCFWLRATATKTNTYSLPIVWKNLVKAATKMTTRPTRNQFHFSQFFNITNVTLLPSVTVTRSHCAVPSLQYLWSSLSTTVSNFTLGLSTLHFLTVYKLEKMGDDDETPKRPPFEHRPYETGVLHKIIDRCGPKARKFWPEELEKLK